MDTRRRILVMALCVALPASAVDTVKVGVVEGLSGPPAITDFGESYLQGLKLALKDYAEHGGKPKIELIVYDDEANPQRAVSLVQRLIQSDNVSIVEFNPPCVITIFARWSKAICGA